MIAAIVTVSGRVQGVGFRWWAGNLARVLGVSGHAINLSDGRVELRAQGEPEAVHRMIRVATETPSTTGRPGWVDDFDLRQVEVDPAWTTFRSY